MLTSLQALLRLAVLQRLGVFICALAVLLATTSSASALEPAQTKTRVWGFDLAEHNSVGLFRVANLGKHQGNRLVGAEAASGSLLAARAVAPSSRALGKALEAAGHVRPAGSAAHHIVAGGAQKAAPARAALEKFGIGINDAANGAFLPSSVHARIHTNAYYETVNSALSQATTRQEALQALDAIRGSLF